MEFQADPQIVTKSLLLTAFTFIASVTNKVVEASHSFDYASDVDKVVIYASHWAPVISVVVLCVVNREKLFGIEKSKKKRNGNK